MPGMDQILADTEAATGSKLPEWVMDAHCALGVIAALDGDVEEVAVHYEAISYIGVMFKSYADENTERLRGVMTTAMRRFDDAEAHFELALSQCKAGGYRVEEARTLVAHSDMLLERSAMETEDGDNDYRRRALKLQDEALTLTQEMGMRPLTERILARREILRA